MTDFAKRILAFAALIGCLLPTGTTAMTSAPAAQTADSSQALIDLSRQKWLWMADRNIDQLETLFHTSARFVHMGATMNRKAELDVIRSGQIQYKRADINETSVEMIGDTAIVYSRLRLLAVVGGNEVTNPFSVTEIYVRQDGRWPLASMAFTRLLGD